MDCTTPAGERLNRMFACLSGHFGPQHWWPADSPWEVMVGAILTQNTNWQNVEKAIANLRAAGALSVAGLRALGDTDLAAAIRPAGYYNLKSKRLRNLVAFVDTAYGGDLEAVLAEETARLREGLLGVKGIGLETADSILLYAAGRPVFVVDAYTHRILYRHGQCDATAGYEELQQLFTDHLPLDPALFNEFHALLVQVGKQLCRRRPLCARCPLRDWPEAGGLRQGVEGVEA